MGVIVKNGESGHSQQNSWSSDAFPLGSIRSLSVYKRMEKMAEVKLVIIISNILGWVLTGITPFVNLNSWQGYILFGLVVLFWLQKLYFHWRKNQQAIKNGELNLRKKEHDITKEIQDDEDND